MARKSTTTTKTPIAKKLAAPPKPAVIKNRIVLAIDISDSMDTLRRPALQAVNAMLDTIREQTAGEAQQTDVAIIQFGSTAQVLVHPTDCRNVANLTHYPIHGFTALYDGVGLAANTIDDSNPDTSYLVLVFTDGGENESKIFTQPSIRRLIADKQAQGNWSFTFQVPPRQQKNVANLFGVPVENVREWEASSRGVETVRQTTQVGLTSYFGARSAGAKSVESFYVETDLSGLKAKQVKKDLTDISARFKVWTVDKEQSVQEFVEAKTKRSYVIGSTYYCLMKKEKVQPNKAVLLMEKGKTPIWGGDEARDLIGLPTDGKAHATVEPGNHSNFDVFVQSTSVNRKLVRGTKVLVDVTHTRGLKPTWDHTAVAAKA